MPPESAVLLISGNVGADVKNFVCIDLALEGAPDETMVCEFLHLLERNKRRNVLLQAGNDHLHCSGNKITKGTIVDATTTGAPESTKNQDGQIDPGDDEGEVLQIRLTSG